MSTFIDLHVLQPTPFANPNRDDLGSPKTMTMGGAVRARISSQCLKRNIRLAAVDTLMRSRRHHLQIAERLVAAGWDKDAAHMAGIDLVDGVTADRGGKGEALLLLTTSQVDDLVALAETIGADKYAAAGTWYAAQPVPTDKKGEDALLTATRTYLTPTTGKAKKKADADADADADEAGEQQKATGKAAKTAVIAADKKLSEERDLIISRRDPEIGMFGRMLAAMPDARVDAAISVAHAFSTHASLVEADYFTAVDDLAAFAEDEGSGAGHLGSNEFTAAVYYRYATINVSELLKVDGDTSVVEAMLQATVKAVIDAFPTGKRSSTAAAAPPALVYAVVRTDQPINLAAAYETPIREGSSGGYLAGSIDALADTAAAYDRMGYSTGVTYAAHAAMTPAPAALGDQVTVTELVSGAVAAALATAK